MRKYIYIFIISLLCCSCVDEFDAKLSSSDTNILCIEGTIRNSANCTFFLSHSVPLDTEYVPLSSVQISDAEITVKGSDGQSWDGHLTEAGTYEVSVGQLSASEQYWIEVIWNGNTYASDPQAPLATPEIQELSWELSDDGNYVNFLVTPASSSSDGQYYRWTFEETWEIHTPLKAAFEYVPAKDSIIRTVNFLNVGWAEDKTNIPTIGSNANYANGQIRNFMVYQLDKNADRFNYRYYTKVFQTAITQAEYEYETLSAQLSDEMGGLFTPQPSALPTNISCQTADVQVIGYIGVSLNSTSAGVYANRTDVNHVDQREIVIADDELVASIGWYGLWVQGWRVYEYHEELEPPVSWTARWCVDCTDPSWGASLIRPDFWEDK